MIHEIGNSKENKKLFLWITISNLKKNDYNYFNSSLNENSISTFNFSAMYNYYIWLLKIIKNKLNS